MKLVRENVRAFGLKGKDRELKVFQEEKGRGRNNISIEIFIVTTEPTAAIFYFLLGYPLFNPSTLFLCPSLGLISLSLSPLLLLRPPLFPSWVFPIFTHDKNSSH
uniref:Transmembrane protein n=1 Tax=Cacopsylla melanoneura TaxID=428564 RepID=A0A8D9ATF7_9HEMI